MLRNDLEAGVLDAILFIRCSSDMFNIIKSDDDWEIESKKVPVLTEKSSQAGQPGGLSVFIMLKKRGSTFFSYYYIIHYYLN